jgi:hypothetical protein
MPVDFTFSFSFFLLFLGNQITRCIYIIPVGETEADHSPIQEIDKSGVVMLDGYTPDGRGRLAV